MRVAFFGTPEVAVPALNSVRERHEVVCVVTQPDRPRGRGRGLGVSPVKVAAAARDLPLVQPASPKDEGFAEALRATRPDALAVVAYGHLLPVPVLEVAPAMNVHFSLLPAYRGAAPVQRALMDGVRQTGVSVFLLEPAMDTGPVVAREAVAVGSDDTAGEVFERLVPIGARLLAEALDGLEAGSLQPQPQAAEGASRAPKIGPDDIWLDLERPARAVHDHVRALNPKPGAAVRFRGKRLLVWRTIVRDASGETGTVLGVEPDVLVACGDGAVSLAEVQPEGKRRMPGEAFARGYRPQLGEALTGSA